MDFGALQTPDEDATLAGEIGCAVEAKRGGPRELVRVQEVRVGVLAEVQRGALPIHLDAIGLDGQRAQGRAAVGESVEVLVLPRRGNSACAWLRGRADAMGRPGRRGGRSNGPRHLHLDGRRLGLLDAGARRHGSESRHLSRLLLRCHSRGGKNGREPVEGARHSHRLAVRAEELPLLAQVGNRILRQDSEAVGLEVQGELVFLWLRGGCPAEKMRRSRGNVLIHQTLRRRSMDCPKRLHRRVYKQWLGRCGGRIGLGRVQRRVLEVEVARRHWRGLLDSAGGLVRGRDWRRERGLDVLPLASGRVLVSVPEVLKRQRARRRHQVADGERLVGLRRRRRGAGCGAHLEIFGPGGRGMGPALGKRQLLRLRRRDVVVGEHRGDGGKRHVWEKNWVATDAVGRRNARAFVCAIAKQSSNDAARHWARPGDWRWFQLRGDRILLLEPGSFIPLAQCPGGGRAAAIRAVLNGKHWKSVRWVAMLGRRCKWLANGEAAIQS